ncbi:hypothetical protein [Spongiivirga citrea]|uniref:Outer membrane beta-barrel protein n=1 Tax=Spongiivirga citrea TaxID=1481457 RepID=A0A6M0CJU3_9FLAO|nr:hypothetical protein [Spongiivirga citrea]NER18206.1 hypothetical protein [Spongiivirga citrea]
MIRRLFVIVAMMACASTFAQNNAASPYSFFGIGDVQFKGTVENRAMGGLGVFSDSIHLNLNNPASLGKLKLTTFGVAGGQNFFNLENDTTKEDATSTTLNYLTLGIPLNKLGAFSFGVMPYSSVGYRIEDVNETSTSVNRFNGEGGVNRAFFAYGIDLFKGFSAGATAHYNFGKITNSQTGITEGVQFATKQDKESSISGLSVDLALNYELSFKNDYKLYSSFVFRPEAELTSKNTQEISTITFNAVGSEIPVETVTSDLGANAETISKLPQNMTFGLGFGKEKKWFLGAEYSILDNEELGNPFNRVGNEVYEDGSRFSAGGFFIPNYSSITSYWDRVVYRAGVRYEELGLRLNNIGTYDFGMSFGVGLPVRNFSNVNVAIEYGQRGTTFQKRIKENYFNINISLSLNDKWFVRRKYN